MKDKRVLVIGGGSGTGRAIAEGAVREGAALLVASTNAEKSRAAAQLGDCASATPEMTDEPAVARLFADASGFYHIAFMAGDWDGFGPGTLLCPARPSF